MSASRNIYLSHPRQYDLASKIAAAKPLQHGGWAIGCESTIFRRAGGGQPEDHATVEIDGARYEVRGFHAEDGYTFLHLPELVVEPRLQTEVLQHIDRRRRDQLSSLHSLQHMFSAEACRLFPNAQTLGSGIRPNADRGWIRLGSAEPIGLEQAAQIDRHVRSHVLAAKPITVTQAKSVAVASNEYADIFRIDSKVKLSGKVRVVLIDGVDANCCSGTHWHSTAVGPYGADATEGENNGQSELTVSFRLEQTWPYFFGDR